MRIIGVFEMVRYKNNRGGGMERSGEVTKIENSRFLSNIRFFFMSKLFSLSFLVFQEFMKGCWSESGSLKINHESNQPCIIISQLGLNKLYIY